MAIRPQRFSEFTGQPAAKSVLEVAVRSAKARGKPLGHVLITGPKGLGKTTLAMSVLPTELGVHARDLVCSSIEKLPQLTSVLCTMQAGELLFLDEAHCLPRIVHEALYSVLEDQKLTVVIGEGSNAKTMTVELPAFTVVMATTREALIPEPMRDRAKHHLRLELYSDDEMADILAWTAYKHDQVLHDLRGLVAACHGTARHAGRLIEACIDTLYGSAWDPRGGITADVIQATLQRLGYSANGLTIPEVKLLRRLAESSGPVGLNTLGAYLDEDTVTLEEVYEPWLLQKSFMIRTPSGRQITPAGKKALKAIT